MDIYDQRSFIGGKVGSFVDKRGNHIEMGLHVFFGCYNNLFRLMKKVKTICLNTVIETQWLSDENKSDSSFIYLRLHMHGHEI